MLVHEFAHSYVGPLIDEFGPKLDRAGAHLFDATRAAMRRQAYGEGRTVLNESLVRAVTARYALEHQGPEAALRAVDEEKRRSFLWTRELLELLGQYAKDREHYPTLESFMPRVVTFFESTSSSIDEEIQ